MSSDSTSSRIGLTPSVGGLVVSRALLGATLVCFPRSPVSAALGVPGDPAGGRITQVLGIRHLIQAELTRRHPTRSGLLASAAVDGLHSLTMVGLLILEPRHRCPAAVSAGSAAALALAGTASGLSVSG